MHDYGLCDVPSHRRDRTGRICLNSRQYAILMTFILFYLTFFFFRLLDRFGSLGKKRRRNYISVTHTHTHTPKLTGGGGVDGSRRVFEEIEKESRWVAKTGEVLGRGRRIRR